MLLFFVKKKQRNCPFNFFSDPDDVIQETLQLPPGTDLGSAAILVFGAPRRCDLFGLLS